MIGKYKPTVSLYLHCPDVSVHTAGVCMDVCLCVKQSAFEFMYKIFPFFWPSHNSWALPTNLNVCLSLAE